MITPRFKDRDCFIRSDQPAPCIEFVLGDGATEHAGQRQGFHAGQLLHYHLERGSDPGASSPPDTLTIAFATADVVVTGWRLDPIADLLREGLLLALRVQPSRYAQVDPNSPAVGKISVAQFHQP